MDFLRRGGALDRYAQSVASFPAAALLYPASLFLLGTGSTSWKHAFRLGWLCGLAGASACLYWLAIPVHDFGGLPWALAAPCPLLMGAYIGLYGGLFAALAHALRGEPAWRKGVALGLGWYLMECFRGWFFTGFPWITLASAFTPWTPVIQLASVIGAYGLGGLLAGLSCLCVEGILRVRHPHALRKRWLPALGRFPCRYLSGCCLRRVFPLFCAFRPRRAVGILGAGQP